MFSQEVCSKRCISTAFRFHLNKLLNAPVIFGTPCNLNEKNIKKPHIKEQRDENRK